MGDQLPTRWALSNLNVVVIFLYFVNQPWDSAVVLGTNSQFIGIGQLRPPRGTLGLIEMPFGMVQYIGILVNPPSFIAPA